MKLRFLALLLVISSVRSFAFSPSWHKYYCHINNAEQLICKGKIRAAYVQYKLAFAINDKNIANTDLYNAFHAAITINDTVFAKKQLHALLRRRVSQKFIDKRILSYYVGWQHQCVEQWVDLYKNDTIVLSETGQYIERLIAQDQDVRRYSSELNNGNVGTDTVKKVDFKVAKELSDLFQKHFFGIDSIGNDKHYPFNGLPYSIIIIHNVANAEMKKMDFLFEEVINRGLEQYYFTPNNLLCYADYGYHTVAQKYMGANARLMFECVGFHDSLFIPKINYSKIGSINLIRKKYGLCTIEEEIVKINYANKMGDNNRFSISGAKRVLDTEERNEMIDWVKTTIYPD